MITFMSLDVCGQSLCGSDGIVHMTWNGDMTRVIILVNASTRHQSNTTGTVFTVVLTTLMHGSVTVTSP